jgi:hypothetical protein
MRQPKSSETSRRKFLGTVMPACAIACLACPSAFAHGKSKPLGTGKVLQDNVHPFDAETPRKLTYREFIRARFMGLIALGKWMMKETGRDETLEYLKKYTTQRMFEAGQAQASKATSPSLREYTEQFRKIENYKNSLVMEIVEDTEKAFELKVTECLWASTFLAADAGDLGTALVCHGDYAWAEGFNPKIKLVRDKTLMQGDSFCNHRYIWTA